MGRRHTSIYRQYLLFRPSRSKVSTLLGRIPFVVGYQPTLRTEMGSLQERISSTKAGSITSIQAVPFYLDCARFQTQFSVWFLYAKVQFFDDN